VSTLQSKLINLDAFIPIVEDVSAQTMAIFRHGGLEVEFKQDQSPVTEADLKNHELLTYRLAGARKAPVLSEEAYPEFDQRRDLQEYWLIDPLDGTKEFAGGIGEFSVLVALIQNHRPVFSAVILPDKAMAYLAEAGAGAYRLTDGKLERVTAVAHTARPSRGLVSRFHEEGEVSSYYQANQVTQEVKMGSAHKFCALLDGRADMYFRHKGPHEWDVAAGDLLVNEAGGQMRDLEGEFLTYNQPGTRVKPFLGLAKGYEWILREA